MEKNIYKIGKELFITNDEEIKEGDYVYFPTSDEVLRIGNDPFESSLEIVKDNKDCKKIILTTDQDLIKEGVQKIDDEFLEWYIKNPSCEEVEIETVTYIGGSYITFHKEYKIIIPKEEPKQDFYKIGKFHKDCDEGCKYNCTKGNTQLAECLSEPNQEQEVCNHCGKTLREQMKGCREITCYRQFLPNQKPFEDVDDTIVPIKELTIDELLKEYGENLTESEVKILNSKRNKQETLEEKKCVAGCKHFYGGEIKHHKDCFYYNDSFSKMYDDLKAQLEKGYSKEDILINIELAMIQGLTLGEYRDLLIKQFKKK